VLYIVRNLRTRQTHITTYFVNIRGIFNPTLIDRVNKLMTYAGLKLIKNSGILFTIAPIVKYI